MIKVIGSYLIWAYLEDLLPLIENYLRFWVSNIQFLRFWLPWRNLPNRQTWFNPNDTATTRFNSLISALHLCRDLWRKCATNSKYKRLNCYI